MDMSMLIILSALPGGPIGPRGPTFPGLPSAPKLPFSPFGPMGPDSPDSPEKPFHVMNSRNKMDGSWWVKWQKQLCYAKKNCVLATLLWGKGYNSSSSRTIYYRETIQQFLTVDFDKMEHFAPQYKPPIRDLKQPSLPKSPNCKISLRKIINNRLSAFS